MDGFFEWRVNKGAGAKQSCAPFGECRDVSLFGPIIDAAHTDVQVGGNSGSADQKISAQSFFTHFLSSSLKEADDHTPPLARLALNGRRTSKVPNHRRFSEKAAETEVDVEKTGAQGRIRTADTGIFRPPLTPVFKVFFLASVSRLGH
jgi:hypothetical protein